MDGREAMAFSDGSGSYYIHRGGEGVGGSGSGGVFQQPPSGFRVLSNAHGGSEGSTFSIEPQRGSFSHGGVISNSIGSSSGNVVVVPSSREQIVKKKRGRPRKYGPDVPVSLRLSPMSANSTPPSDKRPRGRPPGSGRKQQLAALGEWMTSSAGMAFSPHVITIGVQEDIVARLLSFSQHRPRALCILSGTGIVSSVTLRQPASTSVGVTFEGRFQILCLSGSYLVAEDGGPRNRMGGISVSLSSPDGHVIGGGVARLIAASPIQVVVCSFVYGVSKPKTTTNQGTTTKDDGDSEPKSSDKLASPDGAQPNYTASAIGMWSGSRSGDVKSAHPHTGIDLMHG